MRERGEKRTLELRNKNQGTRRDEFAIKRAYCKTTKQLQSYKATIDP